MTGRTVDVASHPEVLFTADGMPFDATAALRKLIRITVRVVSAAAPYRQHLDVLACMLPSQRCNVDRAAAAWRCYWGRPVVEEQRRCEKLR